MRKLLKPKWLFLFFWGIVVFASILILPNITTFVNEQTAMPQDATTSPKNVFGYFDIRFDFS
ncbi:hypothetical protein [Lactiplantibacillus plantarum]|uniref:hypothetical protein n=1 Tax=Lactiplantibacillus plantarum TaxID=1590 RepID=UPI0013D026FE|nr:hypothetical protein [Lactiplantibacillus plantarum]